MYVSNKNVKWGLTTTAKQDRLHPRRIFYDDKDKQKNKEKITVTHKKKRGGVRHAVALKSQNKSDRINFQSNCACATSN